MCYTGVCPHETRAGDCSKPMSLNFSCWLYDEPDTIPEDPEPEEEDPEE